MYDKNNRILRKEEEYDSLAEIAERFGLSRGSDLAFYRLQPEEKAREMELKRFGVWFKIIQEDSDESSSSSNSGSGSDSSDDDYDDNDGDGYD